MIAVKMPQKCSFKVTSYYYIIDNIIVCNVYDIYESVKGKSLILGKPQKSSFLNGSAVRGGGG